MDELERKKLVILAVVIGFIVTFFICVIGIGIRTL